MRHWILIVLTIFCAAVPLFAQDAPPEPSASTVFFLARDDTDQDGQVTDIDNVRLYEVALDGTVLFATSPDVHVLMYASSPEDDFKAAAIIQARTNELAFYLYNSEGLLDRGVDLSSMGYIAVLDWSIEETTPEGFTIFWGGYEKNGLRNGTFFNPMTGVYSGGIVSRFSDSSDDTNSLHIQGETFLIHEVLNDNLLIVQQDGLPPEDALWMYEKREDRLTPFNSWFFVEPLLIASHPDGPRLAVFGREFDGSMSLYTVDLASGVAMPRVTQLLSDLIDPAYTAMQWTADGTSLMLVGESGDFVVSSIGRIEAVYALEIATGAFTRLSPEGILVDRNSLTSR